MQVSRIGYGTWGLAGDAYGPTDDAESLKALAHAFDLGVNFYDTADLYGDGHCETLLGRAFSHCRDKVILATKGGMLPHSGFVMPQDFSEVHLRKTLEASLKRLRTDYVDLYQLHSPPIELLARDDGILNTLKRLRKEGKIRTYGISVRSPQDGLAAIKEHQFPVIQVNFNLIDQRALENGFFESALDTNTGVIVRTPLVFGFLSGELKADSPYAIRDHRANWPMEQRARWAASPEKFNSIRQKHGSTPAQFAIRFCLDQTAVSTVIPGMLTTREVEENVTANHLAPLSEVEQATIRMVYQQNIFYDQKAKSKDCPP